MASYAAQCAHLTLSAVTRVLRMDLSCRALVKYLNGVNDAELEADPASLFGLLSTFAVELDTAYAQTVAADGKVGVSPYLRLLFGDSSQDPHH